MSKGKYNGLSLQMRTICLLTVLSVFFIGCREKNSNEQSKQYNSDEQPKQDVEEEVHVVYANSVKGHHEQDSKTRKWRYLYEDKKDADPDLLYTSEFIRGSGREIVEKGPKPSYIKINYETVGAHQELRDTIVRATYTPITE